MKKFEYYINDVKFFKSAKSYAEFLNYLADSGEYDASCDTLLVKEISDDAVQTNNILDFKRFAEMRTFDHAMVVHFKNLISTYGEETVLTFIGDVFKMKKVG